MVVSRRTWRGERGEQWSSAQGLESVLISIQSLLGPNPYENEPGYENDRSEHAKKQMKSYVEKVWYVLSSKSIANSPALDPT